MSELNSSRGSSKKRKVRSVDIISTASENFNANNFAFTLSLISDKLKIIS